MHNSASGGCLKGSTEPGHQQRIVNSNQMLSTNHRASEQDVSQRLLFIMAHRKVCAQVRQHQISTPVNWGNWHVHLYAIMNFRELELVEVNWYSGY